jgi:small subunit ribosomal protein S3
MGQKIHPFSFRLGARKNWKSRWFVDKKDYSTNLLEDLAVRKFLFEKLKMAGIANVEIERLINRVNIAVYVSRPGMVIGRGGSGSEELKKLLLTKILKGQESKNLHLEILEIPSSELSALLVGTRIASELERRLPYRTICKKAMERVFEAGGKGVKIILSGRVDGSEIARHERFVKGKVPLGTIRAEIDYAAVPCLTKSGYIGVKVWIYKED